MEYLCSKYKDLVDTVKEERNKRLRLEEAETHLSERVEELEKQHARDQAMLQMKTEKVHEEQRKSLKARGSMQSTLSVVKKKQGQLEYEVEEGQRLRAAMEKRLSQVQDELAAALDQDKVRRDASREVRIRNGEEYGGEQDATKKELTFARAAVCEVRAKLKDAKDTVAKQRTEILTIKEEKDNALRQLRASLRTCGELRLTAGSESSEAQKQEQRVNQLGYRLKSVRAAKKATEGLVESLAKNLDQVHGQFGAMSALRTENQRLNEELRLETQRRFRGIGAKEQATLMVERLQEQVESLEGEVERKRTELESMSDEIVELRAECHKWEHNAKSAQESESPRLRAENKALVAQIKALEAVVGEMKVSAESLQKKAHDKEMVAMKHARKSAQSAKSLAEAEKLLAQQRSQVGRYASGYTSPSRYTAKPVVVPRCNGAASGPRNGHVAPTQNPPNVRPEADHMALSFEDLPRPAPTEVLPPLEDSLFEDLESLLSAEPAVLRIGGT